MELIGFQFLLQFNTTKRRGKMSKLSIQLEVFIIFLWWSQRRKSINLIVQKQPILKRWALRKSKSVKTSIKMKIHENNMSSHILRWKQIKYSKWILIHLIIKMDTKTLWRKHHLINPLPNLTVDTYSSPTKILNQLSRRMFSRIIKMWNYCAGYGRGHLLMVLYIMLINLFLKLLVLTHLLMVKWYRHRRKRRKLQNLKLNLNSLSTPKQHLRILTSPKSNPRTRNSLTLLTWNILTIMMTGLNSFGRVVLMTISN